MINAFNREFEFRNQDFHFIANLVQDKTGIVLASHKQDMVYTRIARRLRNLNLKTFREYCHLLQSELGKDEMGNFVNALTTNLTSFFREEHHFEHLRDNVLLPLLEHCSANKRIRLWSSACSSGAEPYSMAMVCYETIPNIERWNIKILATDIDTGMLEKSRAGIYSQNEFKDVPAALTKKYTLALPNGKLAMHAKLKNIISFKHLNLVETWPFKGPFDAVFCRNVIIYFSKDTQKTIFSQMSKKISSKGWLYLGHSETLHGISEDYQHCGKTTYRKVS